MLAARRPPWRLSDAQCPKHGSIMIRSFEGICIPTSWVRGITDILYRSSKFKRRWGLLPIVKCRLTLRVEAHEEGY
ncbi:hypothetical protein N7510_001382 [Penicillium lagena]|uniref:uncharacterized protein n=1 Tax=Penicillium lagena TaxID=94218 RepID=UPI0025422661|nr:uncharacterized protein N7510_001382 [Penicillium lagena]KAJ5625073.1 hypothetical protein N7510_001382 [Penicillium lagena]